MQVIDFRDLGRWIVTGAEAGVTGAVRGAGEATTVGELLALSAEMAAFTGPIQTADADWLLAQGVEPWAGPTSLPWRLPATHHGMGQMSDLLGLSLGLVRRSLTDTIRDALADERARGLDRPRRAGLDRPLELIER